MNRLAFSALFVAAAVTGLIRDATAQMTNATVQTVSPRVSGHSAPATGVKPGANVRVAPQTGVPPVGVNPQRFNPNMPRTIAQPSLNTPRGYTAPLQTSNPAFAGVNAQPITLDPATRQTELRTLAAMRQRRGIVTREGNTLDPMTRQTEIHTLAALREKRGVIPGQQTSIEDASVRETESRTLERMRERRDFGVNNQTLASIDPRGHVPNSDPVAGPQQNNPDSPKEGHGKKGHKKDHRSFNEAYGHHWHEWHDRNWWHDHCQTIVFVNTGYYFLDGSYWYPAYGYDPLQTYYDYDGPVYTYSNLLPDEVISNVQTALQNAGYYYGPITGSLSVDTRAAIANFQRDYGLTITGAIDEPTVGALGLDQTNDYYQTDQGY